MKTYTLTFKTKITKDTTMAYDLMVTDHTTDEVFVYDKISEFISDLSDDSTIYIIDLELNGSYIKWYIENELQLVKRKTNKKLPNNSFYNGKLFYDFRLHNHLIEIRQISTLIDTTKEKEIIELTPETNIHNALSYLVDNHLNSPYASKLTLPSIAMSEFKTYFTNDGQSRWNKLFPTGDTREDNKEKPYGGKTPYEYVLESFHGGWCYVNPKYQNKIIPNGVTYDANKLFNYIMHSNSNTPLPVGKGVYSNKISQELNNNKVKINLTKTTLYEIHLNKIKLKENHLPCITDTNKECEWITEKEDVRLKLWDSEYNLMIDHYDITGLSLISCVTYNTQYSNFFYDIVKRHNLCDEFIDKCIEKVNNAKNPIEKRQAKLFRECIHGKLATKKTESIKPVYIPLGSAIYAKARVFIIRKAQENYDNFIYCDTDSLHIIGNKVNDVKISPKIGEFKIEQSFNNGLFIQQKKYVLNKTDNTYKIVCAGLDTTGQKELLEILNKNKINYLLKTNIRLTTLSHMQIKGGVIKIRTMFTF